MDITDLKAAVEDHVAKKGYSHIVVSVAFLKKNGSKKLLYGKIDYSDSMTRPDPERHDYGDFELVRNIFGIVESDRLVSGLEQRELDTGTERLSWEPGGGHANSQFVASGWSWGVVDSDYPITIIQLPVMGTIPHINLEARPGPPYFASISNAINFYLQLSGRASNNGVDINFPETRGRIKELAITGRELVITADIIGADADYIAKFTCRKGESLYKASDIPLSRGVAKFECAFEPDVAEVALVHLPTKDMLDTKEYRGLNTTQRGVVPKVPESVIKEMIEKGEGKTIEFKQGVQDKDEIEQTAASFANGEGGTMIVGLTDNKTIKGFYDDEDKARKAVQGRLRSWCEPSIDARLQWVAVDGKPMLLIRIEEGKCKPYVVRDKGVFVREGDGDYHATRVQLDAMYDERKSSNTRFTAF